MNRQGAQQWLKRCRVESNVDRPDKAEEEQSPKEPWSARSWFKLHQAFPHLKARSKLHGQLCSSSLIIGSTLVNGVIAI